VLCHKIEHTMAQLPDLFSTLTAVIKDIVENPNDIMTNAQQLIMMMLTTTTTTQSSSLMMHLPPMTPSTKDENLPQPLLTKYHCPEMTLMMTMIPMTTTLHNLLPTAMVTMMAKLMLSLPPQPTDPHQEQQQLTRKLSPMLVATIPTSQTMVPMQLMSLGAPTHLMSPQEPSMSME